MPSRNMTFVQAARVAFALCGLQFNCAQRGVSCPVDGESFRHLLDELFFARYQQDRALAAAPPPQ